MIYYEFNEAVANERFHGVRYWVSPLSVQGWAANLSRHNIIQLAHRIWQETDDGVEYTKNRDTGIMTPVDMREFFLVKLQARTI